MTAPGRPSQAKRGDGGSGYRVGWSGCLNGCESFPFFQLARSVLFGLVCLPACLPACPAKCQAARTPNVQYPRFGPPHRPSSLVHEKPKRWCSCSERFVFACWSGLVPLLSCLSGICRWTRRRHCRTVAGLEPFLLVAVSLLFVTFCCLSHSIAVLFFCSFFLSDGRGDGGAAGRRHGGGLPGRHRPHRRAPPSRRAGVLRQGGRHERRPRGGRREAEVRGASARARAAVARFVQDVGTRNIVVSSLSPLFFRDHSV